ncbi:MAG TPA: hypothetical protein DC017_00435 [Candidatus Wallbacteria bacterium]|nr:hypothetical protein [Candidatus Wallbacteria bacterium]
MNSNYPPGSVTPDFQKLNELYIEVLKINRALLNGGYRLAAPLLKTASPETNIFFGELNVSLVELIDKVRQLKLEILDNIPHASKILNIGNENYDRISDAIYEYVFSGFAICMLESIIKNKIKGGDKKILINAETVWEIFTVKLSAFRLPQMNSFFNDPENADVASMFNLMFDSVYDGLKKEITGLENLKHNIGVFVREIIEKSIIEGMLLFLSYEEAKRTANH